MATATDIQPLYLAWQDKESRQWYTVGKLDHTDGMYRFRYTKGASFAEAAGFNGVISFPNLNQTYYSKTIFPLFANQVLSEKRPEYDDFIQWIALPKSKADPMAILARTSERVSDTLEIYPRPEAVDGTYEFHFFVRGTRHQAEDAQNRIETLESGDELRMMLDVQNDFDPDACMLRTNEETEGDMHLLGYLPRYLASEFGRASREEARSSRFKVVRVNPPPTPIHFRLLCKIAIDESVMSPFSSEEHDPLTM
jgi:hypothetical protein